MSRDNLLKKEACILAKRLLESEEKYLDIVNKLWKIGNALYGQVWDTEFHTFGVIESDADHLPLERIKEHCSAKMLENSENEIKEIIAFYKKDVFKACNEILLKHENV